MPFNVILRHDFLSIIEYNNLDYTLLPYMVTQRRQVWPVLLDSEPPLVYSAQPAPVYMDNLSLVKTNSSIISFKLNNNNKPLQQRPQ